MITVSDMLQSIADLERDTFSDSWSKESIEDTTNHSYNYIYMAFDCRDGVSIVKLSDYIAVDDASLFAGYLIASVIADETELLRIAVKEELRGKGIADKLMTHYLGDAFTPDMRGFLEVRESNTPARCLYEKKGYKQIALRKNYYKNPAENGVIYQIIF